MSFNSIQESLEVSPDSQKKWILPLTIISFVMVIITAFIVISLMESSGYGGTIEDTQLGFNAEIIKWYFALMGPEGMKIFILGNLADYTFMLAYGCFFYSCARYLSRNYRIGSLPLKVGITMAWVGVLCAICDGIENIFLFLMTANPMGFSSWLAIAHSSFATSKFALMISVIGWLIISFILNRIPLKSRIISTAVQISQHKVI